MGAMIACCICSAPCPSAFGMTVVIRVYGGAWPLEDPAFPAQQLVACEASSCVTTLLGKLAAIERGRPIDHESVCIECGRVALLCTDYRCRLHCGSTHPGHLANFRSRPTWREVVVHAAPPPPGTVHYPDNLAAREATAACGAVLPDLSMWSAILERITCNACRAKARGLSPPAEGPPP